MRLKKLFFQHILLISLPFLSGILQAEQSNMDKPLLSDQPHLQTLLRDEMGALLTATSKIADALPQGDWPTVATTAKAIHDSFIFQQKLTPRDRDILHHSLPEAFIHLDKGFHQRALKLHEAAAKNDAELSLYHYARLLETCVQCHQRFATHRFPTLNEDSQHAPHH